MKDGTVIVISRQYGSGGRELAQILSQKLGLHLYDRQLIHIAAAKIGIDDMKEGDLKQLEEEIPPLSLKFMPFYIFGMQGEKPLNSKRKINQCIEKAPDLCYPFFISLGL